MTAEGAICPGLSPACPGSSDLQRSHIVPEFCYKPCYDDNHRLNALDLTDPDRSWKQQKGVREPLLCRVCEQYLNDEFEKPFFQYWFVERPLDAIGLAKGGVLQVPDYRAFKLFHLSVLLRADLAQAGRWREVRLGAKHRARILELLRTASAGEPSEYPITCSPIKGFTGPGSLAWDFLGPPVPGRMEGLRFYELSFGGCSWHYFVASHSSPLLRITSLSPDGRLPFLRGDWAPRSRYKR